MERFARVCAPLVAVPAPTGLRDTTDAALEFEEEEEDDEEVEEESIDRFEHSAPSACAAIAWRVAAKKRGAARSRTANKSSTLLLVVEQNVDAPVPQITVELTKEISQQLVDVPMSQTWEFRGSCADHATGLMQEVFVEVPSSFRKSALLHAVDVTSASVTGTNSPAERADRGMPVPQIMVKSWR